MHAPGAREIPSAAPARRRVLVLGGGDVGSAVAHRLFLAGLEVLIAERAASAHARRGMAFTDALFDGSAVLEGVEARWQPDLPAVLSCWRDARRIPVVTMSEAGLIAQLGFDVIVEATMRRQAEPADLRAVVALAIGIGPGQIPGCNCHVAIETQWGEAMGRVLRDRAAAVRSGGPRALDGVTRERFVPATREGTWRTQATLGQRVAAGETLGWLDGEAMCAPINGTLRGLARDGVEVRRGQRLIEVDPRAAPEVRGLGERPRAIAHGVAEALGLPRN
jgi:xanthine dehydrogenase accessory factor